MFIHNRHMFAYTQTNKQSYSLVHSFISDAKRFKQNKGKLNRKQFTHWLVSRKTFCDKKSADEIYLQSAVFWCLWKWIQFDALPYQRSNFMSVISTIKSACLPSTHFYHSFLTWEVRTDLICVLLLIILMSKIEKREKLTDYFNNIYWIVLVLVNLSMCIVYNSFCVVFLLKNQCFRQSTIHFVHVYHSLLKAQPQNVHNDLVIIFFIDF